MFKVSDAGRSVEIIDPCGANWLYKGQILKIKMVRTKTSVVFEGSKISWGAASESCFRFLDGEEIEVGDIIIIKNDTTTLKSTEERVVLSFLCDDKDKLVVEGILPGGWISKRNVMKKIDLTPFRFKTHIELIKEFGFNWTDSISFSRKMCFIFGKKLSEFKIKQSIFGLSINLSGKFEGSTIGSALYTDRPIEGEYCLVIRKGTFKTKEACDYEDRDIIEFLELRKDIDGLSNDEKIYELILELKNHGHVRVKGLPVSLDSIIIKNNEKQQNLELPFSSSLI